MSEVTQLLDAVKCGDPRASEQLLPLVYNELRRLAAAKMAQEKPGQTLQPTALVHEAYLRLVKTDAPPQWENRRHFFAAAAEAMRRILIENARRKQSRKRAGHMVRQPMDESALASPEHPEDLLALDEALAKLAETDPDAAELVKLRYFSGLTIPQTADLLSISPRSADRLWAFAKAWLLRELQGG